MTKFVFYTKARLFFTANQQRQAHQAARADGYAAKSAERFFHKRVSLALGGWCLLYFPMLFFSGITVPLEVMPDIVQKIVLYMPLTQGLVGLTGVT